MPSLAQRVLPFAFTLLTGLVAADTCSILEDTTAIKVTRQLNVDYSYDQTQYWSTAAGALKPLCILSPTTADEVSTIVKALHQNNETFAIKSGGHNPNDYYSSIDGGPLISTKLMNEVNFDEEAKTTRVGPGNRWEDVEKAMDGTNHTILGGRIGNVGVGGYMLGNGLSFKSAEYGWAANDVINFEVVLANGTVVNANNSTNTDLYKALKGGGNNFGIVTAYTMAAHEQGMVWGGNLQFFADQSNELLSALRDFADDYPDEKAGIIMTGEQTVYGAVDIWIMFLYYNGPEPPPGVFDKFMDIGPAINSCKTRTYADLLTTNNWAVVKGSIYTIATEMTPVPNATVGDQVMQAYYNHWRNTSDTVIDKTGLIASIAFQPIPKSMAKIAKNKGGDLLDLDDDVNRIIFEFDYSYVLGVDTPAVDVAMQQLYGGMGDIVRDFIDNGTLPDVYLPVFQNDAYFRQDYWGRLKPENREFAQRVAGQVDPNGFFQTRTGGVKFNGNNQLGMNNNVKDVTGTVPTGHMDCLKDLSCIGN